MDDARLNNDAPIAEPGQDRLGFGELARHLTGALRAGGLVVGIEGEWGSGKSSLANLALKALETESQEPSPRIVRFSPWIIGNRNELLRQLFSELGSVLPEYRDTQTLLNRYAQSAPILAAAYDVGAPVAGIPPGLVSPFFRWTGKLASKAAAPSLSRQRNELREKFRNHKNPVIVFIDDIDRLEPIEAVEVLRLVRAVADFPNVGYLLAYDPDNLAKCLENAIGVDDGHAYIEKIIQASFAIPDPMGFDLRSWLAEETRTIFDRADLTSEASDRLERALSCWCSECISTPRDVVRTVNALKLHIAPLANRLDPADGLFIQIIRLHRPKLYNWVERYLLRRFGSDSEDGYLAWRHATQDRDGEQQSELARIIGRQGETLSQILDDLRQHLPQASIPDNHPALNFGAEERQQFAAECRLNSPSYFRLYFALSLPAGFLSDEEVSAFLDMCSRDREAAARHFRERCVETRPQGGNMARVLLSRIVERGASISPSQIMDLFTVLGEVADVFVRNFRSPFGSTVRLRGELIAVFHLVKRLPSSDRAAILEELFENTASLAWLNGIVWEAAGEHGLTHDMPKPVELRLLAPEEFDCIRTQFLERLRRADPDRLKEAPLFPGLMEVWCLAGGEEDAKAWVARQTSGDEGLIDLLERLSFGHFVSQPDDYRHAPRRGILETLFGSVEEVERRLNAIALNAGVATDLRENAERLVSAIAAKQQTDEEAG